MRILIIGAGATGRNLAVKLCGMKHDVVLLDRQTLALTAVESSVDVLTFCGHGSSPVMLDKAGIDKTDMVLAVTNQDEVNILACLYAHQAGVSTKVARVSNTAYMAESRWNWKDAGIDLLVSQNEECSHEVDSMLSYPGTLDVVDMLGGRILSIGIKIGRESPLCDKLLEELGNQYALLRRVRFIALLRKEKLLVPRGETRLCEGDDAYLVAHVSDVNELLDWALPGRPLLKRDIIAGGGGVGATLAKRRELSGSDVVLIEPDIGRAEVVADSLSRSLVLKGDVSNKETLDECGISADVSFSAVTGDDELNIVSCVLAKKMGAGWTVAQVGKPEYVPIISHMQLLDRVVSPYATMINVILRFVRGRNVHAATVFQSLPGELLELDLPESSKWCGRPLRKFPLPGKAVVALVQRGTEVFIPGGDFAFAAKDRLAVFTELKSANRIAALFKK